MKNERIKETMNQEHDIYDIIACMDQSQAGLLMVMEHIDANTTSQDKETRQLLNDTYSVLAMIRNNLKTEIDIFSEQDRNKA